MAKKKTYDKKLNRKAFPALFINFFGALLVMAGAFTDTWLYNIPGLSFYPAARRWGLLTVTGKVEQSLFNLDRVACLIQAEMSLGVTCNTPLCDWYASKCSGYRLLMIGSYITLFLLILALIVNFAANLCLLRNKAKALHTGCSANFLACFLVIGAVAVYISIAQACFQIINGTGYYPAPQPSMSLYMVVIGAFLWFMSSCVARSVARRAIKELHFIEDAEYEYKKLKLEARV
ncbi:MAG: hypothetical protein KVP17_003002 [Porospora cf. gigantea B]|uniref:uncharacterized protein n=2 Tax=Porospora cf. gigantea B TaxID=2853592 RepID=UPI003571D14F|nr:MAG: hypothetical protein KVP17_003002 [Porospora cf. gigantea B]